MREKGEITPKKERVIASLVAGKSITGTAKECGVNQATIHTWLKDPTFQAHYRDARRRVFDERLDGLEDAIFQTLTKHINANVRPSAFTQLQALRLWFDMKLEGRDRRELEQAFEEWQAQEQASRENGWGRS